MAKIIDGAMARRTRNKRMQNAPTPSRVLVVDDNHQTVLAVSFMLEALGFEIDAANCGTAALNCLDRSRYDVVLTDLEMPDMTGSVLAAKIRKNWPDTGIVIMTGRSREEIEDHREAGQIEHWILKPFNMSVLETTLDRVSGSDFNDVAC